ncbi:MAG: hypothetical protein MR585_08375 [Selenomonas bovis]|nr:hypothetical protein [Selenomonas bovis]
MNEQEETYGRLQKFLFDFTDVTGDPRQYVQESLNQEGLRSVALPFNFNVLHADDVVVQLFDSDEDPCVIRDMDFFKYLVLGPDACEAADVEHYNQMCEQDTTLKWLHKRKDYFEQDPEERKKFPAMIYTDVTERDLFGFDALSATELGNHLGIWGMHGLRKIEIVITGLPDDLGGADVKQAASFYWDQRESTKISPIYEEEIRYRKDSDPSARKYIVYVNTNRLGRLAAQSDTSAPEFVGHFTLYLTSKDERESFTFPVRMCVHDMTLRDGKNPLMAKGNVSIDFGTSSTCAAVRGVGKPYLFTLSGKSKRQDSEDNAFENPTNLMIYNWEDVYDQWQAANDDAPFFLAKSEQHDEREADYDSGYTVGDEYREVGDIDGHRKMNAILTQLKMLPYWLSLGKEVKFTPYSGRQRGQIRVTDTLDEDAGHFNPIAFYGYLLSRAINHPKNQRFYRNYQITFPVKFDKEVRERIRTSLEYGIKRALPKPIRDAVVNGKPFVSVRMDYSEPVACIGSIVGKHLKLSERDARAKLFAIYDLGGGTMDFSFGMFRMTSEEEDAEEDCDQAVEVLGVDGDDKVGGELLIHKLAYKIYRDNKDVMEGNRIKFVLPPGELQPKGFEGLLSARGDDIADANVSLLKERLARPLFMTTEAIDGHLTDLGLPKESVKDANHFKISLQGEDGEDTEELTLEVKGVDDFLHDEIQKTIDVFYEKMGECFDRSSERLQAAGIFPRKPSDVYIFLSGNASKQHNVAELMKEKFADGVQSIQRVGEGLNNDEMSDEYRINEKTAVAFGQLNLGQYYVDQQMISQADGVPPFLFNVGYIDSGTDEYEPVLQKNDISRAWRKANRIDRVNLTTALYYTESSACERKDLVPLEQDISEFVEPKKHTLYIRPFEEDKIEFRLGSKNESFDENEPVNPAMVIDLAHPMA